MSKRRGGYLGGSTIITVVRESEKRLAARKAHWARKLGRDQIEQCVRGVADDEAPRLIKRNEVKQAAPSVPTPTQSNGVLSRRQRKRQRQATKERKSELSK